MILPANVGSDGDVTVRAWEPSDAEALATAIRVSRDHLAPWMEFAAQPVGPVAEYVTRIQGWQDRRTAGEDGYYGIFVGGRVAGGCGLHRRLAADGLEIGYWVHVDFVRRGICTRTARLLTDAAFCDDMIGRVEIHHDAANVASGAVPARLGYRMVGESPRPKTAPADSGIERRWRVTRAEWFAPGGGHRAAPGGDRSAVRDT